MGKRFSVDFWLSKMSRFGLVLGISSLTLFLFTLVTPLNSEAALLTTDCQHFFGWDNSCLMKKLRIDFDITESKISNDKLLPYVEQNTQNIVALLEMIDYGRNVSSFLKGSTNSIEGDTQSIEEIEKVWWQSFVLNSIRDILVKMADNIALSAASTALSAVSTIMDGYEAYMAATVVLTAKETRFLLGLYCQDRYAGLTVDQAWQDVNDPIYQNLWDLIINLKNIPKNILKQKFEYAYSTYRLVGYPDSTKIRSKYGEAIVSLLSPVSTGSVTGWLHQNSASGPPLPGATVTCGGQSKKTASDGSFSLSGVPTGNQSLSFSMSGYQSYSMSVLITAGQTVDVGDRWLIKNPAPSPTCPSGNGLYCGDSSIGQNSNYLYLCTNGNYSLSQQCSNGCLQNPPGVNDACRTISKTCPSGNGLYCGNSELGQNSDYLYQCTNGTYSIKIKCSYGCKVNPPGTNDVCFSQPTPTSTPDLNIDKVTVKKSGGTSTHTLSLLPGEAFQIDVWIKNVGEATASKEFTINYLLSNDKTFNKYDRVIGVDHVKDDIKEDKTYHDSKVKGINAPSTPGTYYIGAWVDSPEDNNRQNDFSKGDDEIAKIIVAPIPPPAYKISGTVYYSTLSNPLSGVKVENWYLGSALEP